MSECGYCEKFQYARIRKFSADENTEKRKSLRYCASIDDWARSEDTPCEEFMIARYFWCTTDGNRLAVLACLSRRRTGYERCPSCSQGLEVLKLSRGVNLFELHSQQAKLELRNDEEWKETDVERVDIEEEDIEEEDFWEEEDVEEEPEKENTVLFLRDDTG